MGSENPQKTVAEYEKEYAWYQQRLLNSMAVLEDCLALTYQGKMHFIQVIAGQLRMLLCDTTRIHDVLVDVSLVNRLQPYLRLGVLNAQGEFEKEDRSMELGDWLKQCIPVNGKVVTIFQLIRQVSDERGGVHADFRKSRNADESAEAAWMRRIAEQLLWRLKQ